MKPSEIYYEYTRHKYLYNIMLIENIPSVIQRGILCYERAKKLQHQSIAMDEVQQRREKVTIPGGLKLHEYANIYFSYNNPMLYKRKDRAEDLCILAIHSSVLDINDCVISDRNASTDLAKFYSPDIGIKKLEFDKIFAQYWTHENYYEQNNHKAIKCAEILIPTVVPFSYIAGAYVVSENAKSKLIDAGFSQKIVVQPSVFYR